MYYALKPGSDMEYAYVTIVPGTLTETPAVTDFTLGSSESAAIGYDGKVNSDGDVNILDAQIAYDLDPEHTHANYSNPETGLDTLSVKARLEADINGDGAIDGDDLAAIMDLIDFE
jgi:hypothetical protein